MKNRVILPLMAVMILTILSNTVSATNVTGITEKIAEDASTSLNISSADDVLLLTTAGSTKYSNETTEGTIQVVMDSVPHITYSRILQLNRPMDDLTFIFAVKNGDGYHAKKYTILQSGSVSATPAIYIGPSMTETQFQKARSQLGYDTLTILGAWTSGAPYDLLKVAAWTGNVNTGLISAYAASKQFMANYPLRSNSTSYHVIVSDGGGDDDIPMFFMDSTPLKWVTSGADTYYNFRSVHTPDPNENIYIFWDSLTKTGTMLYWTIAETENHPTETLAGLEENARLITALKTRPSALYTILKITSIDYEEFRHLWAAGIDRDYIAGIRGNVSWTESVAVLPDNMYSSMYNSGANAAKTASQAFVDAGLAPLGRGDLLITSAGYSEVSGLSEAAIDGAMAVSGIMFSDVYSLKRGVQTPLWYVFVKKPATPEGSLYAVFVDGEGNIKPVVYSNMSYKVFDISAASLMGAPGSEGYRRSLAVAEAYGYEIPQYADQDYYIVSLANQWACGMPYDFTLSAISGGCPGSGLTQGYILAKMIQEWLPLSGNQYYVYIGVPAHCKEEALMEVLGLSAGRGTYFTTGTRTASDATSLGIAIRWNPETSTGKAILVSYDKNIVNSIQPAVNSFYKTMYWALWYLKDAFPGKALYGTVKSAYSIAKSVTLTATEYTALLAAGDPLEYLRNFVDVTPPTVTAKISGSELWLNMDEDGTIFYSMDGISWQEYTAPLRVSGVTDVYYYAVDSTGNRAGIQRIHLDGAADEQTVTGNPAGNVEERSTTEVLNHPSSAFSFIGDMTAGDGPEKNMVREEQSINGGPEENPGNKLFIYAFALIAVASTVIYLKKGEIARIIAKHGI